MDQLDGLELVIDGRSATLFVEPDGITMFTDRTPGSRRTGLPPHNHLLIGITCDDTLEIPVVWTLEGLMPTREGIGTVVRTEWATTLSSDDLNLIEMPEGWEANVQPTYLPGR